MIWVTYVSNKPFSKINFPIGMQNGIWGVNDKKHGSVKDVKEGDLVAFVYSISWLKAEGPTPAGFSRVGKDKLSDFRGMVKKIIIGRVTRGYYKSTDKVWPDDEIYPHRFRFEIIKDFGEDILFGTEFFNQDFVEAARKSACTQGSVTPTESIDVLADVTVPDEPTDDAISSSHHASEGRPIYRVHKSRERNAKLIKIKKDKVIKETGTLACEVCNFDFSKAYGKTGSGFAECHHINPLNLRDENETTTVNDLAILCANCHRMIHRKRAWLSVDELKSIFIQNRPSS
ncbi:hypothetical protein HGT73_05225 [Rosenbergiella australiborealis]|uniref:HNH domain-containing protein n=1 Tax=Rosenbergiella australiborealis TaxID=1544696 RepID=A0ABS5T343_9GAMM|nr:HNH endonuclease [Rosenbergiella australiborealis]MBT0726788.1 hypothetical protein [Rosenbergiella australiborealis]